MARRLELLQYLWLHKHSNPKLNKYALMQRCIAETWSNDNKTRFNSLLISLVPHFNKSNRMKRIMYTTIWLVIPNHLLHHHHPPCG